MLGFLESRFALPNKYLPVEKKKLMQWRIEKISFYIISSYNYKSTHNFLKVQIRRKQITQEGLNKFL